MVTWRNCDGTLLSRPEELPARWEKSAVSGKTRAPGGDGERTPAASTFPAGSIFAVLVGRRSVVVAVQEGIGPR